MQGGGELVGLPWDCPDYDETVDPATGATTRLPVLVRDMPKVKAIGYWLPITQDTAGLIIEQQAKVRAAYPATPGAQLPLWPRTATAPGR
jgi:hypothetical protein